MSMDDRELLELAAKAAGIGLQVDLAGRLVDLIIKDWGIGQRVWNPLNDDGDALRLAVKLGIGIDFNFADGEGETSAAQTLGRYKFEKHGNDPYAATRRAIVRAAAEIGKGIKQHIVGDVPEDNYYKTQAEAEELARSEIGRE